jgi:bifunctional non-homologous end joining protein LigD
MENSQFGPISVSLVLRTYGRGRPLNAPAVFIHPCQPIVAKQPPTGPGWAHELKHDGYRLQIHVRDGRVRLYTINGADWSKRYPLISESAGRIQDSAILDAEVVWLDSDGVPQFDALHSRVNDAKASACVFDLLMVNGEDLRPKSSNRDGEQGDPRNA